MSLMTGPTFDKPSAYARILESLREPMAQAATETALYEVVVDALHELPTYDWTGIYILSTPQTLTLGPYLGAPTDHVSIPVGRGICGQSAAEDATVLVEDVSAEGNYLACSIDTRAEIVVPIRVRGAYHAQIDVDSHTLSAFDATDRDNLELLAAHIGARLEQLI